MTEYAKLYWCPKCQDANQHSEATHWIVCMECGTEYRLHRNSPERKERLAKGAEIGKANLMRLSVERDERGM